MADVPDIPSHGLPPQGPDWVPPDLRVGDIIQAHTRGAWMEVLDSWRNVTGTTSYRLRYLRGVVTYASTMGAGHLYMPSIVIPASLRRPEAEIVEILIKKLDAT